MDKEGAGNIQSQKIGGKGIRIFDTSDKNYHKFLWHDLNNLVLMIANG